MNLKKPDDIRLELMYLVTEINNLEALAMYIEQNLDIEEKALHFRLDKFMLLDNEMKISKGNDVVKCEISYTTYEQNENTFENVQSLYKTVGLLK